MLRHQLDEKALADLSAELNPHEEQLKGIKGWFYSAYINYSVRIYESIGSAHSLEIGCGEGIIFRDQPVKPFQLDVSRTRLEKAKQHNPWVLQANAYHLPFQSDFFKAVFLIALLEHTRRPQCIVQEVARVLAPGGQMIVCVPNDIWMTVGRFILGQKPYRVLDHVTFFTPRKLRRMSEGRFRRIHTKSLPFPLVGFWLNMYHVAVFEKVR